MMDRPNSLADPFLDLVDLRLETTMRRSDLDDTSVLLCDWERRFTFGCGKLDDLQTCAEGSKQLSTIF